MILAIVKDLFFGAKINEAALQLKKEVAFIKNKKELDDFFKRYGVDNNNHSKNIEFIVIDLNFNELNSLEEIQKIKNNEKLKNKKIIAYCSHIQSDLLKKAKELGADAMPRSLFTKRLGEIIKT